MDERKAFEAWATPRRYHIATWNDGGYYDDATNEVWMAWGAATAAERERAAKVCEDEDCDQTEYSCAAMTRCAAAIRQG